MEPNETKERTIIAESMILKTMRTKQKKKTTTVTKSCEWNHEDDEHKFVDNHVDLIYANTTKTDEKTRRCFLRRAETKNVDKSAKDCRCCCVDDNRRVDFELDQLGLVDDNEHNDADDDGDAQFDDVVGWAEHGAADDVGGDCSHPAICDCSVCRHQITACLFVFENFVRFTLV